MLKTLGGGRHVVVSVAVVLALTAITATPALAVTNGQLDGDGHPYVGLMVAKNADGDPLWRCSGTLMSDTVFLTAGHCTEAPAATAEIWFDADVESGIPGNGYPNNGPADGTVYTHPDYNPNAFYFRDLGIVILNAPVAMATYGALPDQDSLDVFATKRGQSKAWFTAVGYGLQESFPDAASWKEHNARVRMFSTPKLNQINGGLVGDFSLLLSNNSHTGGTCFGDSGGPNFKFDTNTVAGVTSFGLNGNCAGTGGVFRTDRSWSLAFINDAFDGIMGDDYDGGDS